MASGSSTLAPRGNATVGAVGLEAAEVVVAKGVEIVPVFAEDGVAFGEDAMFKGVEAGVGLTFRSAGAGGVLGVEAVRFDLSVGCHYESLVGEMPPYYETSRGGSGTVRRKILSYRGDRRYK